MLFFQLLSKNAADLCNFGKWNSEEDYKFVYLICEL